MDSGTMRVPPQPPADVSHAAPHGRPAILYRRAPGQRAAARHPADDRGFLHFLPARYYGQVPGAVLSDSTGRLGAGLTGFNINHAFQACQ